MMHNPPHPGELLREEIIGELDLSAAEAAESFAMSHAAFTRVINCQAAISPDLAIRLENAGISTAYTWLTMQMKYDLWQAKQRE